MKEEFEDYETIMKNMYEDEEKEKKEIEDRVTEIDDLNQYAFLASISIGMFVISLVLLIIRFMFFLREISFGS